MQRFFADVAGISSRVAHHIGFPDYDEQELLAIARQILSAESYRLPKPAENAFEEYLRRRREQPTSPRRPAVCGGA